MARFKIIFKEYGESAILLEWPKKIDESILADICNYSEILNAKNIKGITDINVVYASMLVNFNNQIIKASELVDVLKAVYQNKDSITFFKGKTIQIPVCYNDEFGQDLNTFLQQKNMRKSEFIALHCKTTYTVYGIGFLPGFLYLGGLHKKLFIPRKTTPNLKVLKGSVAIGGEQTGIYPQNSPGGWHIVGSTPLNLFNANSKLPTFLKAGDKVRFKSISKAEYDLIRIQITSNNYQFKEVV
ncbi:MAG: hypothetical protein BM563_11585 [Bacteroidetes bacterium MedPE-SWsnd-G1]|nr:MAG: hypothetical protein BM563_11585 [Bacteroidetes bacterium MedPE-SWsnd-G1]